LPEDYATSVRLPSSLKSDLRKTAKAQGCSVTWLVVHILEQWFAQKKAEQK
jgi:hypothetical protein